MKKGKGTSNRYKIARESEDLRVLLESLPLNPIPWVTVVRVLAPIVARLAVRYTLKKLSRSLGEDKVNAIGREVAGFIGAIIERRTSQDGTGT